MQSAIEAVEKQRKPVMTIDAHCFVDNPTDVTHVILPSQPDDMIECFPLWHIRRSGMTCTVLDDGRKVLIGGEYEDYYDPNFFIYNDVIVIDKQQNITVYGYPASVFPPTDFHESIKIGNDIWIVGALGYDSQERVNRDAIQVCRLDTVTMKITKVHATGDAPRWLWFNHYMQKQSKCWFEDGDILVVNNDGHRWSLDVESLRWSRIVTP